MTIPTNLLVPLFYAEMDASRANTAEASYPTLLLGTLLSGGVGSADTPYQVTSAQGVSALFGAGSQIHRAAAAYFANDPFGECYVIGLTEPAGTAATGKLTITGPASADGILYLEIAGQALDIPVTDGDTADDIGAAIAAILTTHAVTPTNYPVSAGNAAGVVTLTCKWKGLTGNDISLKVNPKGAAAGHVFPTGVDCVITNHMGTLAEGAGAPALTDAIASVSSVTFDNVYCPFPDATSLGALTTEFNDATGRWSYVKQMFGHVWTCSQATQAQLSTLVGTVGNDQHLTLVGIEGNFDTGTYAPRVPNAPYEVGAAYMGVCAASLRSDPAQPCQTLQLQGDSAGLIKFRSADVSDRFSVTERNTLLTAGVATAYSDRQGNIHVEREVTTYTENPYGTPDNSYQDVQVLFTSSKWLRGLRARIESRFGRSKLNAARVKEIKGEIVAYYDELQGDEIVENTDDFAASLSVTINGTNPNRVDVLAKPAYVAQLRTLAFTNSFQRGA